MAKLNNQQMELAKYYQSTKENMAALARAGTGKTTLLLALQKLNKSKASLFLAFTNATKDELLNRDPSLNGRVRTTYSVGMAACRRAIEPDINVNQFKYENLYSEITSEDNFLSLCAVYGVKRGAYTNRTTAREVVALVNTCLYNLIFDRDGVTEFLNSNYVINPSIESFLVYESVKRGLELCKEGEISFSDMISFPFSGEVEDPDKLFDKYPIVFADEAQDFSMAQIKVMLSCGNKSTQFVIVGDDRQSIFGFAGASNDAFNYLISKLDCKTFPVTTCYRCPVKVLDKAREIVPDIQGLDRDGEYQEILGFQDAKIRLIRESRTRECMVIARVNSYLLPLAIELLNEDVPFNFHRDNIEQRIKGTLNALKETVKFDHFPSVISEMKADTYKKGNITRLDLLECIEIILNQSGASRYSEVLEYMRRLFYKRPSGILMGTTHSFKGSESPVVFGWGMEMFPHPKASTDSQLIQEENLLYVLRTRAKESLFEVTIK